MTKYFFILILLISLCSCQASKEETKPSVETKEVTSPPLSRSESPGLELPQEVATPTITVSATVTPSPILTPDPTTTPTPLSTPTASQRSLRLESLSAMEKAPSFSLKLLHAYRYFGAFDFERSTTDELFSILKGYEHGENYDALSLGVTSKILIFLKDHLQTEFEKEYETYLNTRYQLSVKEALKILTSNDDSKGLFSWKPRYLKKKNNMTLQECEEVKRLLQNALAVKKLAPQLNLDLSVSKRLKQMNQELPENEVFKGAAQDIVALVQELINNL